MGASPRGTAQRFSDLRVRLVSAAVLVGVGGLALWAGEIWFAALVAVLSAAIAWEWQSVTRHRGRAAGLDCVLPVIAVGGAALAVAVWGTAVAVWWLSVVLALALIGDVVAGRRAAALWMLAGCLYAGATGITLVWLREIEPFGLASILWLILVVAASDIGAYFAGKTLGGPKLWPRVSPKKTWSGAVGGVALAFVLGVLFSLATGHTYWGEVATVSALASVVTQAGDLAESALKRHFGVKDASNLIPGHGGVLDRFDGLMAAAILVAIVTALRGQTVLIW